MCSGALGQQYSSTAGLSWSMPFLRGRSANGWWAIGILFVGGITNLANEDYKNS
jgi:hypothetical protein